MVYDDEIYTLRQTFVCFRCTTGGNVKVTGDKPHLVLFVLSGVREAGNDGGNTTGRCNLASVDHDEQLHKVVIDLSTARLHDVDILTADTLPNFDTKKHKKI